MKSLQSFRDSAPESNEVDWKQNTQIHAGEVTTVIAKFNLPRRSRSKDGRQQIRAALPTAARSASL
jgi:hypothetical protein